MSMTVRSCIGLLGAVLIFGARPAAVQAQDPSLQTVEITGTRIRVPNLASQSPITTVSSAEILDEGATNIENVVNELPQVHSPAQNEKMANNATGVANVALRGLGPTRTLILIDGRRLGPATSAG
jgi:iron complex outermembrane receptor protein